MISMMILHQFSLSLSGHLVNTLNQHQMYYLFMNVCEVLICMFIVAGLTLIVVSIQIEQIIS